MRGQQLRLDPGRVDPGRGESGCGGAELGGEHGHPINLAAAGEEPAGPRTGTVRENPVDPSGAR
ncbi:hypothetical protein Cci01nite_58150 [Catellatospora citrea]|uniref:Uncharacterized protein n=1 Tax=Catellatospora citrea TaxID=53366 RepID=A0A8J3P1Z4_9ACTN|nr:hypothetical protein Cci01nite_58150 [Catellatospora citrea]